MDADRRGFRGEYSRVFNHESIRMGTNFEGRSGSSLVDAGRGKRAGEMKGAAGVLCSGESVSVRGKTRFYF